MRHRDRPGLPLDARRGESNFGVAVIVEPKALDYRVDMIAVGERVFEPLEQDDPGAVAKDRSLCRLIKGAAMPVRRDHSAGFV